MRRLILRSSRGLRSALGTAPCEQFSYLRQSPEFPALFLSFCLMLRHCFKEAWVMASLAYRYSMAAIPTQLESWPLQKILVLKGCCKTTPSKPSWYSLGHEPREVYGDKIRYMRLLHPCPPPQVISGLEGGVISVPNGRLPSHWRERNDFSCLPCTPRYLLLPFGMPVISYCISPLALSSGFTGQIAFNCTITTGPCCLLGNLLRLGEWGRRECEEEAL